MKENQTLGYTPEQIQEQIIKAISENQHLKAHTASLVRHLFKEIDKPKEVLRFRVALMLHDTGHYLRLVEDEGFCHDLPRSFVRWVTDWLEVTV